LKLKSENITLLIDEIDPLPVTEAGKNVLD
jgi:hypothetical protein